MKRTKALEILEEKKIPYELGEFEATEFTAEEVAVKLHIPIESVYKTLVAQGERAGVVMAIVPGDRELSLKKLAAAMGDKRCDLVKLGDLQKLTGYLKGGCSPLGAKKNYPVYLDSRALAQPKISVSAGLRGLQMIIKAEDLATAAGASIADIAD